jgi:hypothetical protein
MAAAVKSARVHSNDPMEITRLNDLPSDIAADCAAAHRGGRKPA